MKIDGRTLDHKALEHIRIMACKRVLEDSEKPSGVAASFGFCRTSIDPWLRRIEDGGWESLAKRIVGGTPIKLSEMQRHRVKPGSVRRVSRRFEILYGSW